MTTSASSVALDTEEVMGVLRPGGIISRTIKGYEPRVAQEEMARDVAESYNENKTALIEAGTGTGKSVAYLIPALLWASQNQERTVISTHTINLQEQLLFKDIPFLIKVMQLDLKAVLVKGMHNYLCLRKLEDSLQERLLFPLQEEEELEKISAWKQQTRDGSRSDLPFMPSANTWEAVAAESDACSHSECPHYKECFFFKARKEASDAHILVVNHHLLCADLKAKHESPNSTNGILPSYSRLVLDEGHHLEDVATEHFAAKVNRMDMVRVLARLSSEKRGLEKTGKLQLLRRKMEESFNQSKDHVVSSILGRLEIDLMGEKQFLGQQIHEVFQMLSLFFNGLESASEEKKWRIKDEIIKNTMWTQEILPKMEELIVQLKRYSEMLCIIEQDIHSLKNDKVNEKTKSVRLDINAVAMRLEKMAITLQEFTRSGEENIVKWVEERQLKTLANTQLVAANLDISKILQEALFKQFSTVILCSATLTTQRKFNFIRKRLGLLEEGNKVIERIYDSPFDYQNQALLVVPKDIPEPNDPTFIKRACEEIWNALQASHGSAFILFTSFQMMRACYFELKEKLEKGRFPAFVQGDDQRKTLLNKFKETKYAVLFGTDSFWEGVDVVGDALRLVIIVKLPFKVPSEPIVQARNEAILKQGGDPFLEYSVPSAIVKFKQGFGRLIRNKQDRGCILCLDKRLITKGYGKRFLDSLPNCGRLIEDSSVIQEKMKLFYKYKNWSVPGSNR